MTYGEKHWQAVGDISGHYIVPSTFLIAEYEQNNET
jgi:hypothetical protein